MSRIIFSEAARHQITAKRRVSIEWNEVNGNAAPFLLGELKKQTVANKINIINLLWGY